MVVKIEGPMGKDCGGAEWKVDVIMGVFAPGAAARDAGGAEFENESSFRVPEKLLLHTFQALFSAALQQSIAKGLSPISIAPFRAVRRHAVDGRSDS